MTPNSQFATRHARAIMKPFCCDFFHLLILGPELRESRVALYLAARARFTQFLPQKSTPFSISSSAITLVMMTQKETFYLPLASVPSS